MGRHSYVVIDVMPYKGVWFACIPFKNTEARPHRSAALLDAENWAQGQHVIILGRNRQGMTDLIIVYKGGEDGTEIHLQPRHYGRRDS